MPRRCVNTTTTLLVLVLFDVLKDVLCLVSQLNEDDIVGAEIVLESNKGCVGVEAELGDGNFLR